MSCGLGAVILMFLLVKKNTNEDPDIVSQDKSTNEINLLKKEQDKLEIENDTLKKKKMALIRKEEEFIVLIEDYNSILNLQKAKKENTEYTIKKLEEKIKTNDIKKNLDKIELEGKGQQDYLVGLEIKGKRVLILLDSSASMTDEKLIDIIKRKTLSAETIKQGPKWKRALRIVKWMSVRLPEDSKLAIINFSNDSKILGKKIWHDNNSKDLSIILDEINKIVPSNATNLYAAFQSVREMSIKPDEIFLITDGLPTIGSNKFSKQDFFSKCNSIISNSKKISGDCREKLFISSIKEASKIISSIKINIVLLPLEGDPQASSNFWKLASRNGGLLFVPSKDWP